MKCKNDYIQAIMLRYDCLAHFKTFVGSIRIPGKGECSYLLVELERAIDAQLKIISGYAAMDRVIYGYSGNDSDYNATGWTSDSFVSGVVLPLARIEMEMMSDGGLYHRIVELTNFTLVQSKDCPL